MSNYFDLNSRTTGTKAERVAKSMRLPHGGLETTMAAPTEATAQPPSESTTGLSIGQQILLYVGVLIGVIFSSAVGQFKAGQSIVLEMNAANIAVSIVVALLLVPYVYKQIQPNVKAPLLVQFGLFVQHGVFWQVIFALIGKTMT
ncbi:MAG: hypothetical protein WC477_05820 [Patescibacteria group bacterium]